MPKQVVEVSNLMSTLLSILSLAHCILFTDLVSCVDKRLLREDYNAMMNDPTMPFQLNVDRIEDFCSLTPRSISTT